VGGLWFVVFNLVKKRMLSINDVDLVHDGLTIN
jgi:hypothetical protein